MLNRKTIFATIVAWLSLTVSALQADEVTLRSLDQSFSMTGTLTGFDGSTYQMETTIGPIFLSVSQVVCEGESCPALLSDVKEFSVSGSKTISAQIIPALIEAYAFEHRGDLEVEVMSAKQTKYTIIDSSGEVYASITLNLGNSGQAFSALESGDFFMGLSSRRATDAERNRILQAGKGDITSPAQERILGLDGIAMVVNPRNPIRTLSLEQVSDILAGNIRNWRDVGGWNARINVYRRSNTSGVIQVFENLVMAPARRVLADTAIVMENNAVISDAVAQDPNGIGITNVANQRNAKALALRSVCGQVFSPSEFAIKTEEYPLSRRLFLYTASGPMPDKANEFIEFVTSDAAQRVVEQAGFVSQNVVTMSLDSQGRRLAHALLAEHDPASLALLQEMVSSLLDAERMSLTFRFKSGTLTPDNRALDDIARLAEMVKSGVFDGKRLMIVGFADNIGAINENQRLSQARAESVRDVLVEAVGSENAGNVQFTPIGYGKLSPIGCNETEDGRDSNRRVEVWVR